jgi:cytochrome c-type biogenesis protein CcsB
MTLDVSYFTISLWLYLASFVVFTAYFAFRRLALGQVGAALLFAGGGFQTAGFGLRWSLAGHIPLSNMFEYAAAMSWMAVLSFGILLWKYRKLVIGVFVAPVVFGLVVAASMLPKDLSKQLVPALQSYWLTIHVSLAALGEGAFAVACAVSIMYLVTRRLIQRGSPVAGRLPSLELLDEINHRAVAIGYPLFTIGALFAGAIWAHNAWGAFWSWDPKEVGSLIIWLFYTGYLHARLQRDWRGPRAAMMSILGFVMTLLSFGGNMVLGGNHAYG